MAERFTPPKKALQDPFKPPRTPRLVRCLHCDKTYMSSLMEWKGGLWCCGTPGCDGKGYHFDIFDADDPFWNDEPRGDVEKHAGHDIRYVPSYLGCETLFCRTCDEWIDPKCSDPHCRFCTKRPEKPSMMPRKDLDASDRAEEFNV